ncbi:L-rhamnose catabolism isomerase [Steroidobacter sp. S1-65]|uniref:L-rhamnose catabolism isomerase n=1 Tax=Steroidobacter gossypii TaxID=2805490 RepID=A0ABS1WSD1_9GAMM|nr:L-rhamnose catabolism isomerase [Steroidobacter gossypii]MBM0103866.1 L-rhamnose catabolism isomerase [Steroidobacter gossypii]
MTDKYADPRDRAFIADDNARLSKDLDADYAALGTILQRRGLDIDAITNTVASFGVAIPSWGVGTGGTRFARFPGRGEPRHVFDKLEDCAVIHSLTGATPTVSLHLPWDYTEDMPALRQRATALGLGFDAVNSNTFQDRPGQPLSYKFGSLTHTDAAVRAQAIEHNIDCIRIGQLLGSKALTVWIGDGANFPGQQHLGRAFERYLESTAQIYAALPADWRMLIEHKMFEPAFYATVIQDWGSSLMAAQTLGPKAFCLVDLGHHAPNVNIEMIVSRLVHARRLGGFHFNDSKYGDDDLDTGCIDPYRLFLIFNELVDAQWRKAPDFQPAHMLDQSHNVTDPIESLMTSAIELQRAYAQALLVDRQALSDYQQGNDALMAAQTLKRAFTTDVQPILARARLQKGAAIDPVGAYRRSNYRNECANKRPSAQNFGGGIV